MKNIFNLIKIVIFNSITNDYPGLAAEMAYNFTLSLFPFAIFIVSVFGILGSPDVINQIIALLSAVAPADTLNLIRDVLDGIIKTQSTGVLSIAGLMISLWAASRIIISIIKGMNLAYEVPETRSIFKVNGLAVLTVLILAFVLLLSINLIIFGTTILEILDRFLHITTSVTVTVLLVRWPTAFLALFLIALVIYYFLPNVRKNKRIRLRSSACGALFFGIFWLFGSWLFSLYVENFARYNAVYGTLGTFVVLLVWLYYTSIIILVGGEISSEIYKLKRPKIVAVQFKK